MKHERQDTKDQELEGWDIFTQDTLLGSHVTGHGLH